MLWDVAARRKLAVLQTVHRLGVTTVAFSPDGKRLASGSLDKTIYVWDVASRLPEYHLPAEHSAGVKSVAFFRDGRTLASGALISGPNDTRDPLILWDISGDSWRSSACTVAARNLTAEEWRSYVGAADPEQLCPHPQITRALNMARTGKRTEAQQLLVQTLDWV